MHTRPKYAAKLTREWAKVLGSEHGGGERAGGWKRWKGRAWAEGQLWTAVDVSSSRWGSFSRADVVIVTIGFFVTRVMEASAGVYVLFSETTRAICKER